MRAEIRAGALLAEMKEKRERATEKGNLSRGRKGSPRAGRSSRRPSRIHRRVLLGGGCLGPAAAENARVNSAGPANGHRVSSARSCFTSRDLAGAVQGLVAAVEVVDHVERAEALSAPSGWRDR